MKKTLLILSLLAVALSACSGEASVSIGEGGPSRVTLGEDIGYTPGNYHVYKLCIDGISYLAYAEKVLIVQRDEEDKPVVCVQPAEPRVPSA